MPQLIDGVLHSFYVDVGKSVKCDEVKQVREPKEPAAGPPELASWPIL